MFYDYEDFSFNIACVSRCIHRKGFYDIKGRPFAALALRIHGEAVFNIDHKYFNSHAGDIIFVPENMPYKVTYTHGESIFIHFKDCIYPYVENITVPNSEMYFKDFERMFDYWKKPNHINIIKSTIYNIFQNINNCQNYERKDISFFNAISYINNNYTNPDLSIDEVAKEVLISQSGLRRKFKQYINMSPIQYLQEKRMKEAVNLLINEDLSIKKIAFKCGFSDEKYFSRVIKAKYNVSPSTLMNK